ncbi:LysR family transcriptional regulator [Actinocatenispora thailandica]|uniref:LysR family transcriptional regulator n=1 Tax=Actinocatenispora thailandica TaxID=227318 RepID=A0A7R7DT24_9ACTN|nr:LysR family transcriptional regulator [Actinocatenispora thailandica]BCJ37256.1 LysR family transcriptional regulator [Actinocatenispora thailandica]
MPDLDLRVVRYFVAVAEHEHFGRAASALHVAQPSLSRQIRQLEHQLGVALLDRTPRGTRLTPAGQSFLERARQLLGDAEAAVASARAAAKPDALAVGFGGDLIVTPIVRELAHRFPETQVTARHIEARHVREALVHHELDVVVARTPFDTAGLAVQVLYDEPRVLVVPVGHRLAGKESVVLADFADEPLVGVQDPDADAFWRVLPRPDGRVPPPGPLINDPEDKFEHVASGRALTLAPASRTGPQRRSDITAVPVADIPPLQVVIAHRDGEDGPLLRAFCRAARAQLTGAPRE